MPKKPAKSAAVTFTRPAAERIAAVVRSVERGDRDTKGNTWGVRLEGVGGGESIKLCTFTGSWAISDSKNVRFYSDTNKTASVINHLFTIGDACTAQFAYIAKVSGDAVPYHLINVEHFETPIVTNISLGTAAIEFTKKLAWVPYPGVTAAQFINISTATSC